MSKKRLRQNTLRHRGGNCSSYYPRKKTVTFANISSFPDPLVPVAPTPVIKLGKSNIPVTTNTESGTSPKNQLRNPRDTTNLKPVKQEINIKKQTIANEVNILADKTTQIAANTSIIVENIKTINNNINDKTIKEAYNFINTRARYATEYATAVSILAATAQSAVNDKSISAYAVEQYLITANTNLKYATVYLDEVLTREQVVNAYLTKYFKEAVVAVASTIPPPLTSTRQITTPSLSNANVISINTPLQINMERVINPVSHQPSVSSANLVPTTLHSSVTGNTVIDQNELYTRLLDNARLYMKTVNIHSQQFINKITPALEQYNKANALIIMSNSSKLGAKIPATSNLYNQIKLVNVLIQNITDLTRQINNSISLINKDITYIPKTTQSNKFYILKIKFFNLFLLILHLAHTYTFLCTKMTIISFTYNTNNTITKTTNINKYTECANYALEDNKLVNINTVAAYNSYFNSAKEMSNKIPTETLNILNLTQTLLNEINTKCFVNVNDNIIKYRAPRILLYLTNFIHNVSQINTPGTTDDLPKIINELLTATEQFINDTKINFIRIPGLTGGANRKKSLSLKRNKMHKRTKQNHKSRKTYNTHNTHNTQQRKKHNKQKSQKINTSDNKK